MKLTKAAIEKLDPPTPKEGKKSAQKFVWDDQLPGFGIRITDSGAKSFILQRRVRGREKRMTLGRFPGTHPDIARKEAEKRLGEIASGEDPVGKRERQKLEGTTLEQAFEDYLAAKDLKPRTERDMRKALSETFDGWRDKPITEITRKDVEKRYRQRVAESKARANVAFRYLRAILNSAAARYRDAADRPILEGNPVEVLTEAGLWHKVDRRRTVLGPDELTDWVPAVVRLGEVPEREPGSGKHHQKLRNGEAFRDLFLFMALTGCRKGEILDLRKSDADLHRGLVVFPDPKNREPHELPLTDYLAALIERRAAASPTDYVFGNPHNGRLPKNPTVARRRIEEETGLTFTPHDLRRLFASTAERVGVPAYTVKAVLNHATASRDVTGGYVVVDRAMKLAALEKVEDFILRKGGQRGAAEVVPFPASEGATA